MGLFPEREELADGLRALVRFGGRQTRTLVADGRLVPSRQERALVGASTEVRKQLTLTSNPLRSYDSWQTEAWDYWDSLGEFRFGVSWLAKLISRVRLVAAQDMPQNDEPERLDSGPAVDLIDAFGGGIGGQSHILETLTVHLSVPGDSYLVQEQGAQEEFRVYSTDEIRTQSGKIEVIDTDATMARGHEVWRALAADRLVTRVWRPHKRKYYLADSPARAALPTLRRLELINRKIQAELLSRIASNGVIIFPNEVTLPTDPKYDDEDDPFMAEWIEYGSTGIANPGAASSVMPLPVRMPGEYVDKVKKIDFATEMDRRILAERDSEVRELATTLDVPAEVLLGMGDVNHWSAWQLSEDMIKVPVSSLMELICDALTRGYLRPMLKAAEQDVEDLVVWYDTSEVTLRPDRSENAFEAYDRFEISGEALRRESGFDETDAPEDEELRRMIWLKASGNPQLTTTAVRELGLGEVAPLPGAPTGEDGATPPDAEDGEPETEQTPGAPGTQSNPPPSPEESTPPARAASGNGRPDPPDNFDAVTDAASALGRVSHVIDVRREGMRVLHPGCKGICLVSAAAHQIVAMPGTPGYYECRLVGDRLVVLGRALNPFRTLAEAKWSAEQIEMEALTGSDG